MIKEVTKKHVKMWVVANAKVTNPYKREWWYASVSIGYDYSKKGETIEKAYQALTDHIFKTPFIMAQLTGYKSFKEIWRNN